MTECLHLLDPATCAICKNPPSPKATQATLHFEAIGAAVEELGGKGTFRTTDVASHPLVVAAHADLLADERFPQHIGTYLSDARGLLRIEQVSVESRSNATWRSREARG